MFCRQKKFIIEQFHADDNQLYYAATYDEQFCVINYIG